MTADRRGIRVAVDARMLRAAGIGRYLRPIVRGLLADPRFGEVVLAGDPEEIGEETAGREGSADRGRLRVIPWRGGPYSPRAHLAWPARVAPRIRGVDLAFFPHFDVPPGPLPRRTVVTVHDLTHFVLPELFPWRKRAVAGLVLDRAVLRATRVLVGSGSTRRHLIERLPDTGGRIEGFTYGFSDELGAVGRAGGGTTLDPRVRGDDSGGVRGDESVWVCGDDGRGIRGDESGGVRGDDNGGVRADDSGAVRGGPVSSSPYLLSVGNRKPHKNLGAAVRALAALAPEHPDLRLVFAGGSARDGWEEVARLADELGVGKRIVDVGRVSDPELAALYRGCAALLILSLNEGFGYPALEAMALGAPVVASTAGSLPEVVGEAGLLVDPHEPAAAAAAVRRILGEPALRERLATAGPERAAAFPEPQMVARTLDVLAEAAGAN